MLRIATVGTHRGMHVVSFACMVCRQLKAQASNKVQMETDDSDKLTHVLAQHVEPLQSEADTIAAIKAQILPKYHADAGEVKEVYRLEDGL